MRFTTKARIRALELWKIAKGLLNRRRELGTSIVTISGGEPTLRPELDDIIRRIRKRGMIAGLITHGYFLTPERIERLNQAGLQISIDNVRPDDVSKKSLRVLDSKLENLNQHANFFVNINSVVGSGIENPEDAVEVADRAVELGFSTTLGIIHDEVGKLVPLRAREMSVYDRLRQQGKTSYARFTGFREDLAHGKAHNWRSPQTGEPYVSQRPVPAPTPTVPVDADSEPQHQQV